MDSSGVGSSSYGGETALPSLTNMAASSSFMRLGLAAAAAAGIAVWAMYYYYQNQYRCKQEQHSLTAKDKKKSKSTTVSFYYDKADDYTNKTPLWQGTETDNEEEEEEEEVHQAVNNETTPLLASLPPIPKKAKSVIAKFEQQVQANQRYEQQHKQKQKPQSSSSSSSLKMGRRMQQQEAAPEASVRHHDDDDLMASASSLVSLASIASTAAAPTSSTTSNTTTNTNDDAQQQRCPVCRKKLFKYSGDDDETSTSIVTYHQYRMHKACFVCRECRIPFGAAEEGQNNNDDDDSSSLIQTSISNGKVKLTCGSCCSTSHLVDSYSSIAGQRTSLDDTEQGNVDGVIAEIGDDLEQAVYFMTPRCATCGDDLQAWYQKQRQAQQQQKLMLQQKQHSNDGDDTPRYDVEMPKIKVIGRTVYHPHCFETGRPENLTASTASGKDDNSDTADAEEEKEVEKRSSSSPPPIVKLPPSFCAKFLPPQIILKLSTSSSTLTTLYFYWKDRATEAIQVRQENEPVVRVRFILDPNAPANPNYSASGGNGSTNDALSTMETQEAENDPNDTNQSSSNSRNHNIYTKKVKRKKPSTRVPLFTDDGDQMDVSKLQLELVTGVQVGPRHPIMPKPACMIVNEAQPTAPVSSSKHNPDQNDGAASAQLPCRRAFNAQLTYLHFGLEYCLDLKIPLVLVGAEQQEEQQSAGVTDDATPIAFLDLTGATLSVTIQDWQ